MQTDAARRAPQLWVWPWLPLFSETQNIFNLMESLSYDLWLVADKLQWTLHEKPSLLCTMIFLPSIHGPWKLACLSSRIQWRSTARGMLQGGQMWRMRNGSGGAATPLCTGTAQMWAEQSTSTNGKRWAHAVSSSVSETLPAHWHTLTILICNSPLWFQALSLWPNGWTKWPPWLGSTCRPSWWWYSPQVNWHCVRQLCHGRS
jgi:hypothetical protein